jgi:hypothetical protein
MAQIEMQTTAINAANKTNLPRRFVARLIVSSILSAAGLLSFALTGPIMCRIAAIDPALEAFYLSLVAGWFWSLAWMWSLTFQVRSRRKTTSTPPKPNPKERSVAPCNPA